jgi:hypothetical protein
MKPVLVVFALVFCMAEAQTVAFVDLSAPHKAATPESFRPARGGNHGGACYDCPNQDAFQPKFPLTAKLLWVVESSDPAPGKGAVEVLITNTSEDPIQVPIGVDTSPLLRSPAPDRRSVSFTICAGPCASNNTAGGSETAANSDYPATSVNLRPGESIVFKLPFDRFLAASILKERGESECELSVLVGFFVVEIDKDGEFDNGLPITVKVENSLKWTPLSN